MHDRQIFPATTKFCTGASDRWEELGKLRAVECISHSVVKQVARGNAADCVELFVDRKALKGKIGFNILASRTTCCV